MGVIFKRTKILATIGPATNSAEMIEKLAIAGVNGFRINCSHADETQIINHTKWIRQASDKINKPLAIIQDLQGPKVRLGDLKDSIEVKKNDEITLDYGAEHNGLIMPVQYNLADKVKNGERLFFCDGTIRSVMIEKLSDTAIKVRIENSGVLSKHKGINLPDTNFNGDIITQKDLDDIKFGIDYDFDYVALSFVQSASDISKLRQILDELGSKAKIIAKIETKCAVTSDNLEEIVKVSDGLMVARGDLSTEVGAEMVPIIQRRIIALCRRYGRISIVATQMMLSMCEEPVPTRAEVNDVATAVIQGTDVVMLSDETTVGKFPVETVSAMKRVILYTQDNEPVEKIDFDVEDDNKIRDSISASAVSIAEKLGASAIIVDTKSGATASNISAHRPNLAIASVTSEAKVAQQLCLRYASRNYIRPDSDHVCYDVAKEMKDQGLCGDDDPAIFVVVSGRQPCVTGTTDTIKVIMV